MTMDGVMAYLSLFEACHQKGTVQRWRERHVTLSIKGEFTVIVRAGLNFRGYTLQHHTKSITKLLHLLKKM